MNCGLDFGTSNCSIGIWEAGSPKLVPMDGTNPSMISALYTTKSRVKVEQINDDDLEDRVAESKLRQTAAVKAAARRQSARIVKGIKPRIVSDISDQTVEVEIHVEIDAIIKKKEAEMRGIGEITKENQENAAKKRKEIELKYEAQLDPIIVDALRQVGSFEDASGSISPVLSDRAIENKELGLLRREAAQREREASERQGIAATLYADTEICFGEAAVVAHMKHTSSGYFIKSPKSFLGADITKPQIDVFTEITTRILAFLKKKAEQSKKTSIENVVIGRPVNFHGTQGEKGNSQAIDIIYKASIAAGFNNTEFLLEPVAAALNYERTLKKNMVALVLDAGGGTTDCALVKLGPNYKNLRDRTDSILGYSGARIGGTDLDEALAMHRIMSEFGKTTSNASFGIPNTLFANAIKLNDINAYTEFLSKKTGTEIDSYLRAVPPSETHKIRRLKKLHEEKLLFRLNRSTELAKILLSDKDSITLPLKYIEDNLNISITRDELKVSIERQLEKFIGLMKEAQKQSGTTPDVIYVTGGTAKSPLVQESIRKHFGNIEIIIGDFFGGVASGLTVWSNKIF